MTTKEDILRLVKQRELLKSTDIAAEFAVSRQYASLLLAELVKESRLVKIGSTRGAAYALPSYRTKHPEQFKDRFTKKYSTSGLEEHIVLDQVAKQLTALKKLPENIHSIFTYAASEMLNNAIDHSSSTSVTVTVELTKDELRFTIDDLGIGVFRNVKAKRKLKNELEAIQDVLKGKVTTAPTLHSGEGIFFTSKVVKTFLLDSYGHQLFIDNTLPDIFVGVKKGVKRGTKVVCHIDLKSKMHLNDVFKKYTDKASGGDHGFDRTEIHVRLFTIGGVHISRSQARRVLSGLDKFKVITMDYERVPLVGQAFADEIYRVFRAKHPTITIENIHMNDAVRFMVNRAAPK